jgi:hypothetical protein
MATLKLFLPAIVLVALCSRVSAQGQPGDESEEQIRKKMARIQAVLCRPIKTDAFQEELPLQKFLELLAKQLPKERRVVFRLDAPAFAEECPDVAKTPVVLPPFPKRMQVATALRVALSKMNPPVPVDYGIGTDELLITTPERAPRFSLTYDISEILSKWDSLRMNLPTDGDPVWQAAWQALGSKRHGPTGVLPNDPVWRTAALVQFIQTVVEPEIWKGPLGRRATIRVFNGTTLVVRATYKRHMEVTEILGGLTRLTDLAVVMDAKLFEVDKAFYEKHLRPLFAGEKGKSFRPAAELKPPALATLLEEQKRIAEGNDVKVRIGPPESFLSFHSAFTYLANREQTRTGLEGVSFLAKVKVSPDRTALRLDMTQIATELVDLKKTDILDLASGKNVAIESPNWRRSRLPARIELDDGQPFIMPVDFRSKEARAAGRVWVLRVKPWIYIEEEQALIRKGLIPPVGKEEPKGPAKKPPAPPRTPQVEQLLEALVTDVLTNPALKGNQAFYGTPGVKKFTLVDGQVGWPDWFRPKVAGYEYVPVENVKTNGWAKRMLGIRLDKFKPQEKKPARSFNGGPIEVVLYNAGGSANGAVIGGCFVSFAPVLKGKKWGVEFLGAFDP